jgi:hypothetical protein
MATVLLQVSNNSSAPWSPITLLFAGGAIMIRNASSVELRDSRFESNVITCYTEYDNGTFPNPRPICVGGGDWPWPDCTFTTYNRAFATVKRCPADCGYPTQKTADACGYPWNGAFSSGGAVFFENVMHIAVSRCNFVRNRAFGLGINTQSQSTGWSGGAISIQYTDFATTCAANPRSCMQPTKDCVPIRPANDQSDTIPKITGVRVKIVDTHYGRSSWSF